MCDAVEPRSLVIRPVSSSAVAHHKHASIELELAETTSFRPPIPIIRWRGKVVEGMFELSSEKEEMRQEITVLWKMHLVSQPQR